MRTLYLGNPQELEKKLFDDIAAVKRGSPFHPVIVVVESTLAGVYLRRALAHHGSYCQVHFLTLSALAAGLAEKSPRYASLKILPPFGEEWLAALTAGGSAEGYYAPVARRPGFRQALLQTFRELEDAGLEQIPRSTGSDPQRTAGLQRLFERYRELRRPFAGRTEAFAAAAYSAPPQPFFLALYGIYILSALERELLSFLASHVEICTYWQKSALSLAPAGETLHWYGEQGFEMKHIPPGSPPETNLACLQRNLFRVPTGKLDPPPAGDMSLEFICAPDEARETEEIIREIIRLARAGVRFGEMAVLPPNANYSSLVRERLAAAGIPFYLAGGQSLARTRTGRALLLLLEMIGGGYSRPQVMELLTYAPFDYRHLLDTELTVSSSLWDYLTIKAGVIRGRLQWGEALGRHRRLLLHRLQDQEGDGAAPEGGLLRSHLAATEQLLAFLEIFFGTLDRFGQCHSWTDLSTLAGDFVQRFFYPGEEVEALCGLLKGLCGLEECGGEFELEPALELLRLAVETASLPWGGFQQEGVNLLPPGQAPGLRFTALFIPGLAENIVPSPARMDPLLTEVERKSLAGALPLRRRELEVKALHFTLALGGASRKAVLTWPRTAAAGGREQLPSLFLSRCGEALLGARPGYEQLFLLPGYRYIPAVALEKTVEDPVTAAEYDLACCHDLPPSLKPLQYYRRLSPALAGLLEADLARADRRLGPHEGMFTPGDCPQELLENRLAGWGGHVSATALENYARCPYSYFLKRLLHLMPLEEPEELLGPEPLVRGKLIHSILERFYREAAAAGLLPVERHPGACPALLNSVAGEEFDALPPEELPPYPLLRRLQRSNFQEMLQVFLDWEIKNAAGFVPVEFEFPFGFPHCGELLAALSLPSGEKLYFRGRIDRIDRSGSQIRVIDYKTGEKRFKDESLAGGEALQLPVYLLATSSIFTRSGLEEAEAYAYHLSPAGVKTVLFSGKLWPQKELLLQETVEVLYSGISAGSFFPYPNPGCRFCDYRSICGPGIKRVFRRKAEDPALAAFLKMKGEKS